MINNNYTLNLYINAEKCTKDGKIRFDSVLQAFQDVTNLHSYEMQLDKDTLKASSNAFFVLTKIKFKILSDISFNDTVNLKTWPLKVNSPIRFYRDYQIENNGVVALSGHSEWCVLDYDTRSLRKISSVKYIDDIDYLEKTNLVKEYVNFNGYEKGEKVYEHTVNFCDIDFNNHTNNACYVKMALNVFNPDEFIKYNFTGFEIHFNKETVYGDKITLYKNVVDKGVLVQGYKEDIKIFECLFEF